jgi:hypothetical protein
VLDSEKQQRQLDGTAYSIISPNDAEVEHLRDPPVSGNIIPALCQKFLNFVHVKNPILDVALLWESAWRCSRTGIQWDGMSGLVVGVESADDRKPPAESF